MRGIKGTFNSLLFITSPYTLVRPSFPTAVITCSKANAIPLYHHSSFYSSGGRPCLKNPQFLLPPPPSYSVLPPSLANSPHHPPTFYNTLSHHHFPLLYRLHPPLTIWAFPAIKLPAFMILSFMRCLPLSTVNINLPPATIPLF